MAVLRCLAIIMALSTGAVASEDIPLSGGHPFFWEHLPVCRFKEPLLADLGKLHYHARATFKDTLKGQVMVIYLHRRNGTWFLVVNYIDHKHGCIVARGDRYKLYFGKPL